MRNTVNQSIMPITAKINVKNHLEIGGCDTIELAKQFGTPLYLFDEKTIRTCCKQYKQAFSEYKNVSILYASKSFMTKSICRIMEEEGLGLDVVSGGEIITALNSQFNLQNCTFNGNNKTIAELELAISSNIGRINIDNFYELEQVNRIADEKGKKQEILIRVSPEIECFTHEYIQTGQNDSKFGFNLSQLDSAIDLITNHYTNLRLRGLHSHIGSQIFESKIYSDLVDVLMQQYSRIRSKFGIILDEINVGGGLGVKYTESDNPPSIYDMADEIISSIKRNQKKFYLKEPKLIIEPGRSIVCNAGLTLYTVGSFKNIPEIRKFIAVDGGMTDNPRPAMYQAKYHIILANKANYENSELVSIAGKFCESGDILIKDIKLSQIEHKDIICVFATGAYNYSMSSHYNRSPKPAAVLLNNGSADIIVRRETYQDLLNFDIIPERLVRA